MIPYLYYPKIELDLDYINNLVLSNLKTRIPGMANRQRLVADDPYLTSLIQRYPMMSGVYNIYQLNKDQSLPIHIDRDRFATLNIPISSTISSSTIFYSSNDFTSNHNEERVYHELIGDFTELFRFTLTEPVFMNTKIPHSVDVFGDSVRISMSWSVRPEYSFDDTVRFFSECEQG